MPIEKTLSFKTFINLLNTAMITYWVTRANQRTHGIPSFTEAGGDMSAVENLTRQIIESNPGFDKVSWSENINKSREKKNDRATSDVNVQAAIDRVKTILRTNNTGYLDNLASKMKGSVFAVATNNLSDHSNRKKLVFSLKSGSDVSGNQRYFVYIPVEDAKKVDLNSSESLTRYIYRKGFMNCTISETQQNDVRTIYGNYGEKTVVDLGKTVRVFGGKEQLEKFIRFLNYGDQAKLVDATTEQKNENGKCQKCIEITGAAAEDFKHKLIEYTDANWQQCVHFLAVEKVTEQQFNTLMGNSSGDDDMHGNRDHGVEAAIANAAKELQSMHGDDAEKMREFWRSSDTVTGLIEKTIAPMYDFTNDYVSFDIHTPFNSLCAELNRLSECIWKKDKSTKFYRIAMEVGKGNWETAVAKAYMAYPPKSMGTLDKDQKLFFNLQKNAYQLLIATNYDILVNQEPITFDTQFPVVKQNEAHAAEELVRDRTHLDDRNPTSIEDDEAYDFSGDTAGDAKPKAKAPEEDKNQDSTEEMAEYVKKAAQMEKMKSATVDEIPEDYDDDDVI